MVGKVHGGYLTWPEHGLSLVTVNLLSDPLLRPDWHQVFQFCTVMDNEFKECVYVHGELKSVLDYQGTLVSLRLHRTVVSFKLKSNGVSPRSPKNSGQPLYVLVTNDIILQLGHG